jgi:hypothetical protein
MTIAEWRAVASRISALWPPPMTPANIAAYFEVLREFDTAQVARAVELISRTDRERRPSAGLIFTTVNAEPEARRALPPPPDADVLSAEQHRAVVRELRALMTPEHQRRVDQILELARRGVVLQRGLLTALMSEKTCTPDQFDAVLRQEEDRT